VQLIQPALSSPSTNQVDISVAQLLEFPAFVELVQIKLRPLQSHNRRKTADDKYGSAAVRCKQSVLALHSDEEAKLGRFAYCLAGGPFWS
jgi:hypothetical protein